VTTPSETTTAGNLSAQVALPPTSSCFKHSGRPFVEIRYRKQSRSDSNIIRQIFDQRGFAMDNWPQGRALEKYLRNELHGQRPLIVDAGANIGAGILWFKEQFPESYVFAIEPDDGNIAVIAQNTRGLSGINVFRGALGGNNGKLFLTRTASDAGHRVSAKGSVSVEVIDCDSILALPWAANMRPFICTIDIEGSETEVFAGNIGWMSKFPCIIVELHDWMKPFRRRSASFLNAVTANNFDFITSGEHIFLFNNAILGHMRKDKEIRQKPRKTSKRFYRAFAPVLGRLQKLWLRGN
jgi:FkbM family methyltransferase